MSTEGIFIDLDKICRTCMTEEGEMTSVFNKAEDSQELRIVDMLENFSSIHVQFTTTITEIL